MRGEFTAALAAASAATRKTGAARVGPWRRASGPSFFSFLPGDLQLLHPSFSKEAAAAAASGRSTVRETNVEQVAVTPKAKRRTASRAVTTGQGSGEDCHKAETTAQFREKQGERGETAPEYLLRNGPPTSSETELSPSSVEFPFFKPREHFCFDRHITWYPPHMHKATISIDKCFKYVDCVVEVRDARAPFSTSNPFLLSAIKKNCLRLVLLNKADLVSKRDALRAQAAIEELGTPCLVTSAPMLKRISNITSFVLQHCHSQRQQQHLEQQQQEQQQEQEQQEQEQEQQQQLAVKQVTRGKRFKTIGYWMMLVGLPNTGKSSVLNAMKKAALNAARYGRPNNKIVEGVKRTRAKEGRSAGVTKEVTAYQISNRPRLYCYDTPGIMLPKMKDPETNLRLAALGCVDDYKAGEMYVADYILFLLNRMRRFDYVRALDLPSPSNNIQEVAHQVYEAAYGLKVHRRRCPPPPDVLSGCRLFIQFFRRGLFGCFSLDSLPVPSCMRFFSPDPDSPAAAALTLEEALREPPSPWGNEGASSPFPRTLH